MNRENRSVEAILTLLSKSGVVSMAEFRSQGIHYEYIRRMYHKGQIDRVGRGLYSLPDFDITTHHGLILAAKAIPKGVICLLSALRFYEIGTQAPHEVWIALGRRAAFPRVVFPKVRIVRFSGQAFNEGIDIHMIEGAQVKIFSPSKTVADCFKHRNKIGLDVALEALRECLRSRKCTVTELWKYAKICRVKNVMRPYLEAVV